LIAAARLKPAVESTAGRPRPARLGGSDAGAVMTLALVPAMPVHRARFSPSFRGGISASSLSRSMLEAAWSRTGGRCKVRSGDFRWVWAGAEGDCGRVAADGSIRMSGASIVLLGNADQREQGLAPGMGEGCSHAWLTAQTGQSEEIHSPDACAERVVSWIGPVTRRARPSRPWRHREWPEIAGRPETRNDRGRPHRARVAPFHRRDGAGRPAIFRRFPAKMLEIKLKSVWPFAENFTYPACFGGRRPRRGEERAQ
jgi:hypothetical protein